MSAELPRELGTADLSNDVRRAIYAGSVRLLSLANPADYVNENAMRSAEAVRQINRSRINAGRTDTH